MVGQGRIVRREIEGRARHADGGADVLEPAPRHHRERGLARARRGRRERPGATRPGPPRPPALRTRPRAGPLRASPRGSRRRGRRRRRRPTRAPRAAPCASCADGPRRCCPRSSPRRPGTRSPPASNASTRGRAPCACTPSMRGTRGMKPSACISCKSLPDPGQRAAVSHRDRHPVRDFGPHLLADLEAAGLLALDQRRVHGRVAVVPAVPLASALAQLPGLVVGAAHADDARAEHEELRHLGLRRELGHEDHRAQAESGGGAGQRGGGVAGGRAGDDARAAGRGPRHPDRARAVLERGGGIAALRP